MKHILIIVVFTLLSGALSSYAQEAEGRMLTMQHAFELAAHNSTQLKVSEFNIALARQKVELVRLSKLPELSSGLNYGYLSNSEVWSSSFDKHTTVPIPHQLTQFSVQASEIIFKGGEITNNLRKAALEVQLAALNHDKDQEEVKFLVAAKYLDIYRFINLQEVYKDNIRLSLERLKNILSLQKQGVVTNNDVLRTKLIISDLELAVRKTDDNIRILNQELNTVLGLDINEKLIPDSSMLEISPEDENLQELMTKAMENNKGLKIAGKEVETAQKNLDIVGADRYPRVGLFAANNFQHPFTNASPALDIYYNTWLAGVSITYNISSIYQSPQKRKAAKLQIEQTRSKEILQRENVEVRVNADLIKFNEARYELTTYTKDLKSAEENFRIVETKYFNQLALLADLIDATNTKIEAELKVSNARINIIYTQYQLKRSIGLL